MNQLPYSFHLGSNKNRKASARSNAKNNLSNTTSLANNGIQNYQQLSKVNNHDFRKYDNDIQHIYILKGTNDLIYDVKEMYKSEFEEARIEYNNKQSRPSRMINDYFEYVSNDEKRDLACEIIIELGNKKYWDSKDLNFKKKMIDVYQEQLNDLEEMLPYFKITNAVVHLDETSPHMHIIGIPIKENCKTGLSKQVNKSYVFAKEMLEIIQEVMREKCIDSFNNVYKLNMKLKTKEQGRNQDIHVKDMVNYDSLMRELQVNKKSIENNTKKIESINTTSKELNDLIINLDESKLGGYRINAKQKERLSNLLKEVEELTNYFDNFKDIINNLNSINDNLHYQKSENRDLEKQNDKLIKEIKELKHENNDLFENQDFLKSILKKRNDEHLDLITYLSKESNSKEITISKIHKEITNELYKRNVLSKSEKTIIFTPRLSYTKSDISKALNSINRQMDESAEEFYKINQSQNENDYSI